MTSHNTLLKNTYEVNAYEIEEAVKSFLEIESVKKNLKYSSELWFHEHFIY